MIHFQPLGMKDKIRNQKQTLNNKKLFLGRTKNYTLYNNYKLLIIIYLSFDYTDSL